MFARLENKKIAFLGLGMENYSLIKFLAKEGAKVSFTICDAVEPHGMNERFLELERSIDPGNLHYRLGGDYDEDLEGFDVVFRSPGYPLFSPRIEKAIQKEDVEVTSAMRLFFEVCPSSNIIGVTGTKGKGTTASLITHILKGAGEQVFLGGNIGIAPFDLLGSIGKNSYVVLELSSFHLEDMDKSPRFSVITNLYEEHLMSATKKNPNYHQSLDDYWQAKLNIIRYQKKGDKAVINKKIKKIGIELPTKAKKIFFTSSDIKSRLIGKHNKENIAAATEIADLIGVDRDIQKENIASFRPLPFRLELEKVDKNNIAYYNDSFSTVPDSAMTAIGSFNEPIILLAGGADKGSDFNRLANIIKKRVKFLVLFAGDGSVRLAEELREVGFDKDDMITVSNITDAVKTARGKAEEGDVVLLSPGCASFGIFKDYKQRGELFRKEVTAPD